MAAGDTGIVETASSAIGSVAYAITHPRRTVAEKHVIQKADTWDVIDNLESDVDIAVFHAINDELISFDDCKQSAEQRPNVLFVPTAGGHSNIYKHAIQDLIIAALISS